MINDEAAILAAIAGVLARGDQVVWGFDVTGTVSGLLLALLAAHGQWVMYVPGRTVNQMTSAYRGEAKTDARDAYVIAETLRHRGDLAEVEVATSSVAELRLLVTHRTDLVGDRVRMVNRLRDVLSGYFPALDQSFDYARSRGALTLLTGYQTPAAVRRTGESRLRAWLVKRKVCSADQIATAALVAAKAQQTVVPGQDVAASIVADLATQLLAIGSRISELDARITTTFRAHPQAEIIESMPGMGPILGDEVIAAAGDLGGDANAGRLASAAGLVPVPRDSGRRTGNLHRDDAVLTQAAQGVLPLRVRRDDARGTDRDYYLKKRGQGHGHVQALIALAVAASMCCGHCSATTVPSNSPLQCENQQRERLDNIIENPQRVIRHRWFYVFGGGCGGRARVVCRPVPGLPCQGPRLRRCRLGGQVATAGGDPGRGR